MASQLQLQTFGGLHIWLDGVAITNLASRKAEALLVYLARNPRAHPREVLADMLWDNREQAQALANLRVVLSSLRQQLGDFVDITRTTAAMRPGSSLWLDATVVETALQQALAATTTASYEEALDLYQGPFLEGFYLPEASRFEAWQVQERERLHLLVLDGLQKRVGQARSHTEYDAGIAYANRLLALEPLSEKTHRRLMEMLARSGLRERALAQYETCRELLAAELGIEPEPATSALYRAIQAGPLQEVVPPANEFPREQPRPLAFLEDGGEKSSPAAAPFVARERELNTLARHLEEAMTTGARIIFVMGEAGAGKTALQEAFARQAENTHPNLLVALGQCNAFAGAGDPYLPFCDIFDTLAGGVEARWQAGTISSTRARRLWHAFPDVFQALLSSANRLIDLFVSASDLEQRIARASLITSGWAEARQQMMAQRTTRPERGRQQLFSQATDLLRQLAARYPLLLILEDLHWADTASVGLLFHLVRRLENSPILFLGTYRPEELALECEGQRHPLLPLLHEFTHLFGNVSLTLDSAKDRDFIDAFLDTEPNRLGADFRTQLFQRTAGHPLYTVELLRALQARGDVYQDESGHWVAAGSLDWQTLPPRVRGVIAERLERLDPWLREILSLASVEGITFTGPLLAELLDVPERELLSRLARELDQKHRLVREVSALELKGRRLWRYRFAHPMFQEYLYARLGEGERRHLHAAVAERMEPLFASQPDTVAVPLAHHYYRAGIADKAIKYNTRAGDLARRLYAHDDAATFYRRTLGLLKEAGELDQAARTLMKLGLTYHEAFAYERARGAYDEGFTLWQRAASRLDQTSLPVAETLQHDHPSMPEGFDPITIGSSLQLELLDQLFSGLVAIDPDLNIIPSVARSWKIARDGRHYRFSLRDDCYWSDGCQVTASDFVCAWTRLLDPARKARGAFLLHDIVGAAAFNQGEANDKSVLGIRAVDDFTLELELERPTSYFLYVLAQPEARPVPWHTLDVHGEIATSEETTVTNGPFRLARWRPNERLVLERDPHFPDRTAGNVQRIQITVVPDAERRLDRFVDGASDFLELDLRPPAQSARIRLLADNTLSMPRLLTWYLAFNVTVPPLDDPRIRRALVLAINRERWADMDLPGNFLPADGGVIPPGMIGHVPGIGLAHDPDRARRLLAEAGYPGGRSLPAINFSAVRPIVASELCNQWQEQLSVTIAPDLLKSAVMVGPSFRAGRIGVLEMGWLCDCPDPDYVLRVGMSDFASGHEPFMALVEEARGLTDQNERLSAYRKAEQLLIEEVIVFPLMYGRTNLLIQPWVKQLPVSALKWWFFQDAVIQRPSGR